MNTFSLRFKSIPLQSLPPTVIAWQALAEARIVLAQPLP
jgi:hypothetical protein